MSKDSVTAGVVVRAASPLDAAAVSRVDRESWRTTYAGILPLDFIARHAGRKSEATWRARLAASRGIQATWIAERTEHLGGHPFGQIAYGWHDLAALVAPGS